jgi:hypothetical protein
MPGSIRLSICAGMVVEELTRDGRSSEAAAIELRAQMEKRMGLKDLDRKFCIAPMMDGSDGAKNILCLQCLIESLCFMSC